ncbi:hypothetical protein VSU19_19125 [Verrucomicrobiales bacterium BCK34]|nr:hypothetical protein [Verrucomicrobiales bacterium BCK34]
MSVEFNRVSLPSFSQLHSGLGEDVPVGKISDHDRFPSWEFVMKRDDEEGLRLLYCCAEGGFMWVHVNSDGMAHRATSVSNDEARQIWIDHLLHFTEEEKASLKSAMQPGVIFNDALKNALGWKRVMRSFYLPEVTGSEERLFCAHDGGLVGAHLGDDEALVSYRLIEGREAWAIVQPHVDPD